MVLPASCLWTSLRDSEGLTYDKTLKELKTLYPAGDNDDMEDCVAGLSNAVPESIRSMVMYQGAIKSLGSMIWWVAV